MIRGSIHSCTPTPTHAQAVAVAVAEASAEEFFGTFAHARTCTHKHARHQRIICIPDTAQNMLRPDCTQQQNRSSSDSVRVSTLQLGGCQPTPHPRRRLMLILFDIIEIEREPHAAMKTHGTQELRAPSTCRHCRCRRCRRRRRRRHTVSATAPQHHLGNIWE